MSKGFNNATKLNDIVDVRTFGAKADSTTNNTPFIQAALDSGAKAVYIPSGTYLLDSDLSVPAGVELYGDGKSSILRMIGRDTHARNCALFAKYEGQAATIATPPAMIVVNGSDSTVRDITCDGNGLNNYYLDGETRDYINETLVRGYAAVRIGRMRIRTGEGDPSVLIQNSTINNVSATLTAWGAFYLQGKGNTYYIGTTATDEQLIGAKYCSIQNCSTFNVGSNNITTFYSSNCSISKNTIKNNVHAGIKVYYICTDILIDGNEYSYDEATDVSWRWGFTPAWNREFEMFTRSDAIAVGHSDYDTLIKNISVIGNKLNGSNKIKNGINIYSNTKNVKVTSNHVTGFVDSIAVGISSNLDVSSNTLESCNYTTQYYNVGTVFPGSDIQFTDRSIESAKSSPANICVQHFCGNIFEGKGCSHVRGNTWGIWTDIDCGIQAHFSSNTYNNTGLTDTTGYTVNPVMLNSKPNGSSGYPSSITFESDEHVYSGGIQTVGSNVFTATYLWTFVRPYGFLFTFEPQVIGSTTAGTTTYNSTRNGIYSVRPGVVDFSLQVGWSAQTGTGDLRVTGLPIAARSTVNLSSPASLACHCSGLTFSNQLTAAILNSATTVDFYQISSGGSLVNVPLDTAVNVLRVSGSYFIES